jgi:anaerobic ribonucleoside-triphosphate reductase
MARKCNNCAWEGKEAKGIYFNCPICGDNTREIISDIPVDMSAKASEIKAEEPKTEEKKRSKR